MSFYRQGDGLSWPPLFSIPENEKKEALKRIQETNADYSNRTLAERIIAYAEGISIGYSAASDPCVQTACERVALKFMLCDSTFAEDLLTAEELSKANEVYARKQFNSKLLQKLLIAFLNLLYHHPLGSAHRSLFTISILDEIRKVQDEEINRSFGPLKKVIESSASGVKGICYYKGEQVSFGSAFHLNDALNEFLVQKTNYDFNKANRRYVSGESSTLFCNSEEEVGNGLLQRALLDDSAFWQAHKNFNVVSFLNEIVKQNDSKHGEKVLSFIVDNLRKMRNMDVVYAHGFPLYVSLYDQLTEQLEEQTFRFSFKRLESYCDVSAVRSVPLCYPMCKRDDRALKIGKSVWDRFISEYNYPDRHEAVTRFLKDEVTRFVSGETRDNSDIAVILDSAPFRYSAKNEDREFFEAYHPDCFSFENIWNRVYLKAYAVTLLSSEEKVRFSYLHRIFFDLLRTVEKRTGICTAHQLDLSTRNKSYEELKQLLSDYGVQVSDDRKNDYVIALLDRDTATMEETALFPALEQTGDAIYGLAVAELLFYNPATERMAEWFEDYTRAESQVLISKKQGFDKLYLQIGNPAKYVEFDSIYFDYESITEERMQALHREKYLADSLEMIIGAVYRDAGIDKAIGFAKELLLRTFPKTFQEEIHPTDQTIRNRDIDPDYWTKILPAPCSVMTGDLHTLWNALNKAVLVISLGTDEKEKRQFITNSFGNTAIYGDDGYLGSVSWAFYDYLNNGLSFVLAKYGEVIRENFTKNKRH